MDLEPLRVPLSLLRWSRRPAVDDDLGALVLADISSVAPVLGYNC